MQLINLPAPAGPGGCDLSQSADAMSLAASCPLNISRRSKPPTRGEEAITMTTLVEILGSVLGVVLILYLGIRITMARLFPIERE